MLPDASTECFSTTVLNELLQTGAHEARLDGHDASTLDDSNFQNEVFSRASNMLAHNRDINDNIGMQRNVANSMGALTTMTHHGIPVSQVPKSSAKLPSMPLSLTPGAQQNSRKFRNNLPMDRPVRPPASHPIDLTNTPTSTLQSASYLTPNPSLFITPACSAPTHASTAYPATVGHPPRDNSNALTKRKRVRKLFQRQAVDQRLATPERKVSKQLFLAMHSGKDAKHEDLNNFVDDNLDEPTPEVVADAIGIFGDEQVVITSKKDQKL